MPALRTRLAHLLSYSILLMLSFMTSLKAQVTARPGQDLDALGDWNYIFVAFAALAGGAVAAMIPTAIDSQMKFSPAKSKMFIGFFFGFFACWAADRHYSQYSALDFVFPAFICAAIGAPVMVYLINIANDPQTWGLIVEWVKARLGITTPKSGG